MCARPLHKQNQKCKIAPHRHHCYLTTNKLRGPILLGFYANIHHGSLNSGQMPLFSFRFRISLVNSNQDLQQVVFLNGAKVHQRKENFSSTFWIGKHRRFPEKTYAQQDEGKEKPANAGLLLNGCPGHHTW